MAVWLLQGSWPPRLEKTLRNIAEELSPEMVGPEVGIYPWGRAAAIEARKKIRFAE